MAAQTSLALVFLLCFFCDDTIGYLEVSSDYELRPNDVYAFGDTVLAPHNGKLDAVLNLAAGTGTLVLKRGNATYNLCNVTIKKKRIVSVALSNTLGSSISCKVTD